MDRLALRTMVTSFGVITAILIVSTVPRTVLGDAAPVAPPTGGAPPVTINSCGPILNKNASQSTTIAGIPIPIPASSSSGIAIEFVNESTQAATLVNFDVDSAGDQFVIRDVGSFAPGVSIKHQYRNGAGQAFILPAFISPNVTCHVASVKFADGSVWHRGQPAAPQATVAPAAASAATLSATPSRLNLQSEAESQLFLVSSSAQVAAFKETDDCGKIASIFVAATGDSSATYSVKPIAAGTCTAHVSDEAGDAVAVPIVIQ
jgi:hypothetical protein